LYENLAGRVKRDLYRRELAAHNQAEQAATSVAFLTTISASGTVQFHTSMELAVVVFLRISLIPVLCLFA
jgi:hypothetical protein